MKKYLMDTRKVVGAFRRASANFDSNCVLFLKICSSAVCINLTVSDWRHLFLLTIYIALQLVKDFIQTAITN